MFDRHLETFIQVAQAGSFSAAADRLFISRTALIQQINLFERQLGFRLFQRSNKGVVLTAAGKLFYDEANKMIRMSHELLRRCGELAGTEKRAIRIGTLPNFAPVLLPEVCQRFRELHPQADIDFIEFSLERYFQSFLDGEFDITTEYMTGYMFEQPGYHFVKLTEDRHCCGIPKQHPLRGRDTIAVEDLQNQRVIMYARGITRADDMLRDYLLSEVPDITIVDITTYNSSLPIRCELEQAVLIYYSMYWQSFPSLRTAALDVDFPIDIGLGYREDAHDLVHRFVALAQSMCR